jgi:hypothetical protein
MQHARIPDFIKFRFAVLEFFCCIWTDRQTDGWTVGQTVGTFDLNRRFPALRTRLQWQKGFSVRSLQLETRMNAYINVPVKENTFKHFFWNKHSEKKRKL